VDVEHLVATLNKEEGSRNMAVVGPRVQMGMRLVQIREERLARDVYEVESLVVEAGDVVLEQ